MTTAIRFAGRGFREIASQLITDNVERSAILLARKVEADDKAFYLVFDEYSLDESDFLDQSPVATKIASTAVFDAVQFASKTSSILLFVHTHPMTKGEPAFSSTDDRGEAALWKYFSATGVQDSASIVISSDGGAAARPLGRSGRFEVVEIGSMRRVVTGVSSPAHAQIHERQVRAFGTLGQTILEQMRVGVVGLGGTGSLTVQQLAYLGVRSFVLIDPDSVDETNLNRLVGAQRADIGQSKVAVAERALKSIQPEAHICSVPRSVIWDDVARQLIPCDFVFCCTDSHGSRAILNQLAYQFYVPVIDMGTSILVERNAVSRVVGRVQMLSPGLGCLTCGGLLDAGEVRLDLMDDRERRDDPYFLGTAEPQPAVVSLNSTVSSLAVTMFLGAATSLPFSARFQLYDARQGTVRAVVHEPRDGCVVCSRDGALGRGNSWELPTRKPEHVHTQ